MYDKAYKKRAAVFLAIWKKLRGLSTPPPSRRRYLLVKVRVRVKISSVTLFDLMISSCVIYVYRDSRRSGIRICYSFETPSLYCYGCISSSELPKSRVAGRLPPTLRSGPDLAVFLGLCNDRNRTKAINYALKCCQLSTKHDSRGFMAISAIAASLLFC